MLLLPLHTYAAACGAAQHIALYLPCRSSIYILFSWADVHIAHDAYLKERHMQAWAHTCTHRRVRPVRKSNVMCAIHSGPLTHSAMPAPAGRRDTTQNSSTALSHQSCNNTHRLQNTTVHTCSNCKDTTHTQRHRPSTPHLTHNVRSNAC
jgi:hypothetical protein